jgi:hypothetical protein
VLRTENSMVTVSGDEFQNRIPVRSTRRSECADRAACRTSVMVMLDSFLSAAAEFSFRAGAASF